MKRVLIFSLAYYPSFVSGAEAAIKEITDRIDPTDIEFHMVTLLFDKKAPREELIGRVHVHRVGFGGAYLSKVFYIPLAAIKGVSLNRKHNFDALWSMMTYMLFPVVLARMLGIQAPHILTLQDGDPYQKVFGRAFIRPLTPLLDYGFRSAAVVQAISVYLGEWPKRRGYKGRVEVINNGANPKDLKGDFDPAMVAAIKSRFGKKRDEIYLVNTARLEYQKGFDTVIRALSLLPENIKFLIVGAGTEEANLKNLTKELGLSSRVIFTGKVDRSEVTTYRKASDIFVGPSRSEGLGNAFLSGMASKLPVVATREGGLADFLFDSKHNPDKPPTGWVVNKDNPREIAEAIQDILANPKKVGEVTDNARNMVLKKYDWDNIALQMRERIFKPVLM